MSILLLTIALAIPALAGEPHPQLANPLAAIDRFYLLQVDYGLVRFVGPPRN